MAESPYLHHYDKGDYHYDWCQDGSVKNTRQQYPLEDFYKDLNDLTLLLIDDDFDNFIKNGLTAIGNLAEINRYADLKENWKERVISPALELKAAGKAVTWPRASYFKKRFEQIMAAPYNDAEFLDARRKLVMEYVTTTKFCQQFNEKNIGRKINKTDEELLKNIKVNKKGKTLS